jgi:D-alanyl-D-alanine carboxypeptidase/D-alanyl-D-alanine-endopeptidase (penicillin-binding protein 4)
MVTLKYPDMNHKLSIFLFCSLMTARMAFPQATSPVADRLTAAVQRLEADSSMRHAVLGFCVVDAAGGAVVFERNVQVGLAPASCQKLFTSAAVLDLLGPGYRYVTRLGYDGKIREGVLNGNLYLIGSGDPTLGSWRYDSTKEEAVLRRLAGAVKKEGIRKYTGNLVVDDSRWGTDVLPRGWIWEDIGNYYGAGAWGLNWHENQYDVRLQAGKTVGDPVKITGTGGEIIPIAWINELTTGAPGSGDNAYIFLPPYGRIAFLRGTVPLQKEEMVISGSLTIPARHAGGLLQNELREEGIAGGGDVEIALEFTMKKDTIPRPTQFIGESVSPRLDSINYWFLKKSINLYGEALVKTLALEKTGSAGTEKGVELVRDFWEQRGIDRSAIHIIDGSGLSPQNRVTADALVKVLQYARTRPWYAAFYQALPLINGMHMKSGAIGGARSYAGYQLAADGKEYVFSIIVNNYDGSSSEMVKKLFEVLNILKGR